MTGHRAPRRPGTAFPEIVGLSPARIAAGLAATVLAGGAAWISAQVDKLGDRTNEVVNKVTTGLDQTTEQLEDQADAGAAELERVRRALQDLDQRGATIVQAPDPTPRPAPTPAAARPTQRAPHAPPAPATVPTAQAPAPSPTPAALGAFCDTSKLCSPADG